MSRKIKQVPLTDDIEFSPLPEFKEVAKLIFSNSKEDSDKQLEEFQLSNEHHKSLEAKKEARIVV